MRQMQIFEVGGGGKSLSSRGIFFPLHLTKKPIPFPQSALLMGVQVSFLSPALFFWKPPSPSGWILCVEAPAFPSFVACILSSSSPSPENV